jgi:hypothetical protein
MPDDEENWWDEDELRKRVKEGLASREVLEEVKRRLPSIGELGVRIFTRLSKMPPMMRAHYVGEILAISRDLSKDLELQLEEDEELAMMILALLNFRDDDDDEGEEEPDLPKIGDLVTA